LGGKRSTEACRILKNLRRYENGGQRFNPVAIGKWETYFINTEQGTLPEKKYLEFGFNEIGMDKFNLDIEIVKMTSV